MTTKEYKKTLEKLFYCKLQRKRAKMTIDESFMLSIYYFIGIKRFGFTAIQLAELISTRGDSEVDTAHNSSRRHWKRVEVSPVYNFMYLKAIMYFFPNELEEKRLQPIKNIKYKNDVLNRFLMLDDETIDFFCETRLKPFLKMQESKVTNNDLIQKQILTRTM